VTVRTPLRALPLALLLLATAAACRRPGPLLAPERHGLDAPAPDSFAVLMSTSRGDVEFVFHRGWSPRGVDRVHWLASNDFWAGARIYRVNASVVQFGYTGVPAVDSAWGTRRIADEPVVASNTLGRVSFARGGPDTRGTQLFVNRTDNVRYDTCCNGGFPPVGEVRRGMDVVLAFFGEYGEEAGMAQDSIRRSGNPFLDRTYPRLDSIIGTRVTARWGRAP
jgi:cyclophilin family peptidyl-prolyl cis-trans isomerase